MEGYTKIARLMTEHPEFAVLRQFRLLNMQNLLYLQAELSHLEAELKVIASHDKHQEDYMRDWWSISNGRDDDSHNQWGKVLEIREKLENYSLGSPVFHMVKHQSTYMHLTDEAILKQSQLLKMSTISPHNLSFLRNWMERPTMGAFPLLGIDSKSWDEEHETDLVSLSTPQTNDHFSEWFITRLIPFIHRKIGERFKVCKLVPSLQGDLGFNLCQKTTSHALGSGLYEYSDKSLHIIIFTITAAIASIIPLASVLLLYIVQSNTSRLGVIVALSVTFSLALALMTNARKIEIFAATSA